MKSEIYLAAASELSKRDAHIFNFSCHYIQIASNSNVGCVSEEREVYEKMFGCKDKTFLMLDMDLKTDIDLLQETRIMALCLAAAVVKREKKSYARSVFGGKFKQV